MKTGFIQKITSHSLARNSAIVFAGSMTSNVLAYAYHLFMGRLLGPSGYGELSSLLSILYIFTVPLTVVQTVLVKYISGFKARGNVGQSKTLFETVTKLLVIFCIVGLPVIFLLASPITSFLHLSSTSLFITLYLLFVFSLLAIPIISVLQGYQRFIWVSAFGVAPVLIRLLLSIPMARWGVEGVLMASTIAGILAYAMFFPPIGFMLKAKKKPTELKKRDAFGYALPTLLTLLGITSLYSTDIILVRHFFASYESGLYAAIAILGKIIFYASSAVGLVLFPVVSERSALGTSTKKLVGAAVSGVAFISSGLTVIYFFVPDLIVRLLFGNAYRGAGALLGQFGVFITFFSVGYILATACLALGRTRVWIIATISAIAQIASIALFHNNINTVIMINIIVSALFVFFTGLYYFSNEKI